MVLVAYARVSTEDQSTDSQMLALRQAGCSVIFEEHASGGDRDRPVLAKALASLRKGDTLVVARIDRLARSLFHLLEVIDGLCKGRMKLPQMWRVKNPQTVCLVLSGYGLVSG